MVEGTAGEFYGDGLVLGFGDFCGDHAEFGGATEDDGIGVVYGGFDLLFDPL